MSSTEEQLRRFLPLSFASQMSHFAEAEVDQAPGWALPNFGASEVWTAAILITSPSLELKLRLHFDQITGAVLASDKFEIDATTVTLAQQNDFMKEACNLWGGVMKRALAENGLTVSMGLPGILVGLHAADGGASLKIRTESSKVVEARWSAVVGVMTVGVSYWCALFDGTKSLNFGEVPKSTIDEL